jgi:hypothetical protein
MILKKRHPSIYPLPFTSMKIHLGPNISKALS